MVTHAHPFDPRADRLDHAGAFVAQCDWQRIGQTALDHLQISVAESAGVKANKNVALLEFCELNIFDGQRQTDLMQHGGLEIHGRFLLSGDSTWCLWADSQMRSSFAATALSA
jgi:hypothetical protein